MRLFEETYRAKYLSDFREFVFESSVEDFCDISGSDIVVSTVHKAKGKEFDNVYMLLSTPYHLSDDELRCFYVGITRAKHQLFIHTDASIFDGFQSCAKALDDHRYAMPDEVILQLTHKDVNLAFFKTKKKDILDLRSGDHLRFENNTFYIEGTSQAVGMLSQKMQGDLRQWVEKQYYVFSATIRFIVAWRPKDAPKDEQEYAVLLVDLTLLRQPSLRK